MAPLRHLYCRGWNSGFSTLRNLIDSLDLCFIQEHWLLGDHDIGSDFFSTSVSGMDSSSLLAGHICSILYIGKPLSSCII